MSLRADWINPFLSATVSVIRAMASQEPVPGKPCLKKGSVASGDVSGIVAISGEADASLCITFSKECILPLVSRMLGEKKTEIDEDVKDAVGELTNVISGDSRRRLQEIGFSFRGGIPSVVSGPGHEVKHITPGPILSIPFQTPAGGFVVEVCFR